MLEIVKFGEDEYDFPCLLVLGCFDGLHSGHSELLKKAKLQAKINGLDLGVMMFENGKDGEHLYSFEERVALVESFNAKFVLKINYNDEFKQIKPLEFLNMLEEHLNVKAYMSGKDFRFGQGAKGKASTLKSYAEDEDNGVWYMPVKDLLVDGEKVSTSGIKTLLAEGDIKKANLLLGRNYSVSGVVIHGADRGEKVLGFPTVNLEYPTAKVKVKKGVYTVKCKIDEREYYGIANYGARPTFGEENELLEVYLDGFNGSLYDEFITVEFLGYIRDIQKFDNAEQLGAQLAEDLLLAKAEAEAAVAQKEVCETPLMPTETATAEEVTQPETEAEVQEEAFEAELAEEAVEQTSEEVIEEKVEKVTEETSEAEATPNAESAETEDTEVAEPEEDEQEEVAEEVVSD